MKEALTSPSLASTILYLLVSDFDNDEAKLLPKLFGRPYSTFLSLLPYHTLKADQSSSSLECHWGGLPFPASESMMPLSSLVVLHRSPNMKRLIASVEAVAQCEASQLQAQKNWLSIQAKRKRLEAEMASMCRDENACLVENLELKFKIWESKGIYKRLRLKIANRCKQEMQTLVDVDSKYGASMLEVEPRSFY